MDVLVGEVRVADAGRLVAVAGGLVSVAGRLVAVETWVGLVASIGVGSADTCIEHPENMRTKANTLVNSHCNPLSDIISSPISPPFNESRSEQRGAAVCVSWGAAA